MTRFKLGDRVKFNGVLRKDKSGEVGSMFIRKWVWKPGGDREGVIVGKRVIADNYVVQEVDKLLPSAIDVNRLTVYLVAYDMQKAPVYVLPERLEQIP